MTAATSERPPIPQLLADWRRVRYAERLEAADAQRQARRGKHRKQKGHQS
jgi:hypothetical protein